MPVVVPVLRRRRGSSRRGPSLPPAALTLVAVEYVQAAFVRLTFNRAIDVGALDPAMVRVSDVNTGDLMMGVTPVSQPTPASVQMNLQGFAGSTGPGVTLSALSGNGIVAQSGGEAWAGASDLAIPFG